MLKEDDEVIRHIDNPSSFSTPCCLTHWFRCPKTSWLDKFYAEETDIGSTDFLGINVVGCNKEGHDAIRLARMGMSNADSRH